MTGPGAKKAPVIKDVAAHAGVSVPTVSRVLTGAARVSDDKRARVLESIEMLGFRPSAAARALVARQPKLIAILAGDTTTYGYAQTIRGVEEQARANGMSVTITVVESAGEDDVDRAVGLVLDQPIAGIVVLKFDPPGVAAVRRIPAGIPVVAISGVRERSIAQAVLDEAAAADELVTYMLGLGHATVHHVRVPPSRREDGRTTGWRRALRRAGVTPPQLFDASWAPETGRSIGLEVAARHDVTAVFCGNDEIAMGVIRGINDGGKSVPADISVAGFDDHPLAALWAPAITTVRQDFAALGARAYQLLDDVMERRPRARFSSAHLDLVIRDSTAVPPAPRTQLLQPHRRSEPES